jgi:PDZ-binding kinase
MFQELDSCDSEDDDMDLGFESAMGTRPLIPDAIELTEEYDHILELFYVCTHADFESRPDAKTILDALKN